MDGEKAFEIFSEKYDDLSDIPTDKLGYLVNDLSLFAAKESLRGNELEKLTYLIENELHPSKAYYFGILISNSKDPIVTNNELRNIQRQLRIKENEGMTEEDLLEERLSDIIWEARYNAQRDPDKIQGN